MTKGIDMIIAKGDDTGFKDKNDNTIHSGDIVLITQVNPALKWGIGMVVNNYKPAFKEPVHSLWEEESPSDDELELEDWSSFYTIVPMETIENALCKHYEGKKTMLFFKDVDIFKGAWDMELNQKYDDFKDSYEFEIM